MDRRMDPKSGASTSAAAEIRKHRKEKSARLLFEVHNLEEDANLTKDNTGKYVCMLCKTKHLTELSYVRHREGKKHSKRMSAKEGNAEPNAGIPSHYCKNLVSGDKIGYAIVIDYKLAKEMPSYRFVSSLEQHVEDLNDDFRYIVFVCKPYENIGFKFENREIEEMDIYEDIDEDTGTYRFHFYFSDKS